MTNRRDFITLLGGAAAWPLAARAQQGSRVRRIGYLASLNENDPVTKTALSAFTQALADLAWTDGRNVRIDFRWHGGDSNRIPALAQELVGLRPDIIMTSSITATVALQRETRTIPVVFVGGGDPVASGIVPRLNQPGGNITGFARYEASLAGKWLELLSEMAPGLKRAAIMFNPDTAIPSVYMPSFETAARSLKVVPIPAPVHSDLEIETAIIDLGREPGDGLVVMPDLFMIVHRASIISAAARYNVPAVYNFIFLCQRRRFALLRSRPGRHPSSCRLLCRSHPARRKAGRPPGAASDQVRDGREPQDRHGARPCHTPVDPAARGRGDRVVRAHCRGRRLAGNLFGICRGLLLI
jgi:putative ABC transport system substrate-binding protein